MECLATNSDGAEVPGVDANGLRKNARVCGLCESLPQLVISGKSSGVFRGSIQCIIRIGNLFDGEASSIVSRLEVGDNSSG